MTALDFPRLTIAPLMAALGVPSPRLWGLVAGVVVLVLLLVWLGQVPLKYNLRNLMVRWRTTLLTALAFTLVISVQTVMLAFVNGMAKISESSGQPGNVIILSEGVTDEVFSNLGFSDIGDIENHEDVVRQGDQPLASRETYVVVNQPLANPRPGGPKRRFVQVRGVEDAALAGTVHGMQLEAGSSWLDEAGVESVGEEGASGASQESPATANNTLIQAVLGEGIAREMARDRTEAQRAEARNPDRLMVGDRFELGDRNWVVVGVMEAAGSAYDSEVWASGHLVRELFGKNGYTSLVLRTADAEAAQSVGDFFQKEFDKAAVQGLVETEYFASLAETSKQFLYCIIVVTLIMALGGMLGVMNTMYAAISQRTADIGVLRLVGFQRWQILLSFLFESLTIALLGGLLGLGIGMLFDGWTATSILSSGQGGGKFVVLRMSVDENTLFTGLAVALTMGLFGGLFPAVRAVRLRPLEALR